MPQIHAILNNAYILFCLLIGLWSSVQAARNQPLGGQFWGALATNSILAGAILLFSLLMALTGIQAHRWVYYLYAVVFCHRFAWHIHAAAWPRRSHGGR